MNLTPRTAWSPTAAWVWLCAVLAAAGWGLSLLHALNQVGYLACFAAIAAALFLNRRHHGWCLCGRPNGRKLRRRFSRLFPAGFAIVAGLAVLGGLLHPPSNFDALAYRVPRVLHWLAAEQWHWLSTEFTRINTRATGYEWVAAPLMLLLRTDRFLFLINGVCLLLLPGLLFSLYRRLGVKCRVAWHWMWLLPTGYSFILQAGGIGNDLYGGVLAVAAVDFALRARASGRFADAATSCVAAGLLTAAKTSNLPLGLTWLLAIWPCWRLLMRRPASTLLVGVLAVAASFLPTALMNHRYCGDWTGAHAENLHPDKYSRSVTVPGNLMVLTVQNLAPPIFPVASKWNAFAPRLMTKEFHAKMKQHFEPSGANLAVPELQNEEFSGLGLGLCCLVAVSLLAGWCLPCRSVNAALQTPRPSFWLLWSPWVSALAFMGLMALGTAARIFTPYYLLLLPALLVGRNQPSVCRQTWWCRLAVAVFALAGLLVILTPSRPLWPANTLLEALTRRAPENAQLQRAYTVYSVYGQRADALAELRDALPRDEMVIGLITSDDPETSLWRPFGSRRFVHFARKDTREAVLAAGIRWLAVKPDCFAPGEWPGWLERMQATVVRDLSIRYRAARGPIQWCVVRLADPPAASSR